MPDPTEHGEYYPGQIVEAITHAAETRPGIDPVVALIADHDADELSRLALGPLTINNLEEFLDEDDVVANYGTGRVTNEAILQYTIDSSLANTIFETRDKLTRTYRRIVTWAGTIALGGGAFSLTTWAGSESNDVAESGGVDVNEVFLNLDGDQFAIAVVLGLVGTSVGLVLGDVISSRGKDKRAKRAAIKQIEEISSS